MLISFIVKKKREEETKKEKKKKKKERNKRVDVHMKRNMIEEKGRADEEGGGLARRVLIACCRPGDLHAGASL